MRFKPSRTVGCSLREGGEHGTVTVLIYFGWGSLCWLVTAAWLQTRTKD